MNEYNDKGEKHGPWEVYWNDGNIMYKENYINGKEHGLNERYYSNGKLGYIVNYVNGNFHGLHEDYNYEENLLRKQFFL